MSNDGVDVRMSDGRLFDMVVDGVHYLVTCTYRCFGHIHTVAVVAIVVAARYIVHRPRPRLRADSKLRHSTQIKFT